MGGVWNIVVEFWVKVQSAFWIFLFFLEWLDSSKQLKGVSFSKLCYENISFKNRERLKRIHQICKLKSTVSSLWVKPWLKCRTFLLLLLLISVTFTFLQKLGIVLCNPFLMKNKILVIQLFYFSFEPMSHVVFTYLFFRG